MRSARLARTLAATAALGVLALPTAAAPAPTLPAVDADDQGHLRNFEHVFGFEFPGGPATDQGTDIEFYTPVVPRRDYTTGALVLDEAGDPILEERDFAIVGSYDRGAFVFDITDPEDTQFVTLIACNQRQNDVQIKQFGDRWVLALARDGAAQPCVAPRLGQAGAAGIALFDITDPFEAFGIYSYRTQGGAHNFTFHPTKPYGWVSTGDLPGGLNHIPIIDLTDLDNPRLVADVEVLGGPHDIVFNADGTRAYVASENNFQIWDSTDPANPVLVSMSPAPAVYVHGADPTPDGKTLIVTDESLAFGGFFANGSAVCPGGGITLYDIEGGNEEMPVPLSYALADHVGRSTDHRACTAHVGRVTPDSKHYVTGWYLAGIRVFDISDPRSPTEVGHAMMPGTEVWAAKFHKGDYIYTGDLARGFDVFRWTGPTLGNPPVGS